MPRSVVWPLLGALVVTSCASFPSGSSGKRFDSYEAEITRNEKEAEHWQSSGHDVMAGYFEQQAQQVRKQRAERDAGLSTNSLKF